MYPTAHFPVHATPYFLCGEPIPANPVEATSADFLPCEDCCDSIQARVDNGDDIQCPECGDNMDPRRALPRAVSITRACCSECVAFPRREALRIERERRVAAFGEGRC